MGRAAVDVVLAGLVQAEGAVHGEADLGGVGVFLAVVFPPADGAQREGAGCLQGSASAAWAAKTSLHSISKWGGRDLRQKGLHGRRINAIYAE
jgi:hypothetical protein